MVDQNDQSEDNFFSSYFKTNDEQITLRKHMRNLIDKIENNLNKKGKLDYGVRFFQNSEGKLWADYLLNNDCNLIEKKNNKIEFLEKTLGLNSIKKIGKKQKLKDLKIEKLPFMSEIYYQDNNSFFRAAGFMYFQELLIDEYFVKLRNLIITIEGTCFIPPLAGNGKESTLIYGENYDQLFQGYLKNMIISLVKDIIVSENSNYSLINRINLLKKKINENPFFDLCIVLLIRTLLYDKISNKESQKFIDKIKNLTYEPELELIEYFGNIIEKEIYVYDSLNGERFKFNGNYSKNGRLYLLICSKSDRNSFNCVYSKKFAQEIGYIE